MKTKLKCILLIDDDPNDILFHKRAIEKANVECEVIAMESATLGLEFIQSRGNNGNTQRQPDLIFVDINLPAMNGWDFIAAYQQGIKTVGLQTTPIIVMLSASGSQEDEDKAKSMGVVSDLLVKPLRKEMIQAIVDKHFS